MIAYPLDYGNPFADNYYPDIARTDTVGVTTLPEHYANNLARFQISQDG